MDALYDIKLYMKHASELSAACSGSDQLRNSVAIACEDSTGSRLRVWVKSHS
jgi:hypothetical protein